MLHLLLCRILQQCNKASGLVRHNHGIPGVLRDGVLNGCLDLPRFIKTFTYLVVLRTFPTMPSNHADAASAALCVLLWRRWRAVALLIDGLLFRSRRWRTAVLLINGLLNLIVKVNDRRMCRPSLQCLLDPQKLCSLCLQCRKLRTCALP